MVLVYFLVTVAFWLYRLNAALGKYDPLFIIPLLQARARARLTGHGAK